MSLSRDLPSEKGREKETENIEEGNEIERRK
jgi:hypothetical protein